MRPNTIGYFLAILLVARAAGAQDSPMRTHCGSGAAENLSAPTLKVLTLNIGHGRNTSPNQLLVSKKQTYANLDAIARLIDNSGADIVGLQEADAPSRWSGNFDHVAYLADSTRHRCVVHGLHSQTWISTYGAALLSRATLSQPKSPRFPPSPPTKQKGYVSAEVRWQYDVDKAVGVTVVAVHLDFLSRSTRDDQVLAMISGLAEVSGPLLILGDLNSEWSDPRSHVRALASGLGLRVYEPDKDEMGTYKNVSGKRLDWILASPDLAVVDYKVLPSKVSDHFAVFAEFEYTAGER